MKIILLGAPGVGKGTQADLLYSKLKIPKISTGDMLRSQINQNTPLGKEIKGIMSQGNLVPDNLITELVNIRVREEDCVNGYLLDGFPRTINQAKSMEQNNIFVDYVLNIHLDDKDIISRITGRRVHQKSGRTYHIKFNPPKVANKDDVTGENLILRADDKEETIKNRLDVYHKQTSPLLDYYKKKEKIKLITIDGNLSVDSVFTNILKYLT